MHLFRNANMSLIVIREIFERLERRESAILVSYLTRECRVAPWCSTKS